MQIYIIVYIIQILLDILLVSSNVKSKFSKYMIMRIYQFAVFQASKEIDLQYIKLLVIFKIVWLLKSPQSITSVASFGVILSSYFLYV